MYAQVEKSSAERKSGKKPVTSGLSTHSAARNGLAGREPAPEDQLKNQTPKDSLVGWGFADNRPPQRPVRVKS